MSKDTLTVAISQLQEEIDSFEQGTKNQPADGSANWYLLRAYSLGLSYLKRLENLGVHDDAAASERLYRKGNIHFKGADVPPPDFIEKETPHAIIS